MSDRKRPRSTYVNKRFLSRTLASAACSKHSHGRATTAGPRSHDEMNIHDVSDKTRPPHSGHSGLEQRRPGKPRDPQRGTAAARKIAEKWKHSIDSSQQSNSACSGDKEQSDVYDVHDYVKLNKQYKLQKQSQTIAALSNPNSCGVNSCSSAR